MTKTRLSGPRQIVSAEPNGTANATEELKTIELTPSEQREVRGLMARQRELQEKFIQPYEQDVAECIADITRRLSLSEGVIKLGSTHVISPDGNSLVPVE